MCLKNLLKRHIGPNYSCTPYASVPVFKFSIFRYDGSQDAASRLKFALLSQMYEIEIAQGEIYDLILAADFTEIVKNPFDSSNFENLVGGIFKTASVLMPENLRLVAVFELATAERITVNGQRYSLGFNHKNFEEAYEYCNNLGESLAPVGTVKIFSMKI